MAVEVYIEDILDKDQRLATEYKVYAAQGKFISPFYVAPKILEKSNGFSSKLEMITELESLKITVSEKPDSQYLLSVPDDKIKDITEIIRKSGYAIVPNAEISTQR